MLRPVSSSRTCASTSAGEPCRKSWLNTRDAWPSGGMATPVRDHDRLRPPLTASVSDGNRVSVPICSATSWSSEMELRNELLAGCGGRGQEGDVRRVAAVHGRVRHAAEDGEVGAVVLQQFQVRRGGVVAAGVLREERLRQQAEVVADAEQPPRRRARRPPVRTAPASTPESGSASATPAPRRNRRREIGRRVEANGTANVGPGCRFIARPFLLVPEQFALHDRVDDAADAVLARPSPRRGSSRPRPGRRTAPARPWRRPSAAGPGSARSAPRPAPAAS